MNHKRRALPRKLYDGVLVVLGGWSIGWFAWYFGAGHSGPASPPLWPFAIGSMVLALGFLRLVRRRHSDGRSRLVHLLWIPVGLFVALMTMVLIALSNWE